MTIYWRIGKLVVGGYILVQAILFAMSKLPVNAEAIQKTAQTLLNAHLHQRLPEYYYKVAETTEVWESVPALPTHNRSDLLIGTLLPGNTVTVLDSALVSNQSAPLRWLKVAFEGSDQKPHTGWILANK